MISKTLFCILCKGIPIDGVSTSTGITIPLMTFGDKLYPNLTFNNRDSAERHLHQILLGTLVSSLDERTNIGDFSIGMLTTTSMLDYSPINGYDLVLDNLLKTLNKYDLDAYVPPIIHQCVIKGFATVLPVMHGKLFDNPVLSRYIDDHVPFFVHQNMERFKNVGINTCTPEEIGAIILTSTDELLKAIQIDSFNKSSK